MEGRSLRVLEFDRIISMLVELTITAMGKEISESLVPLNDYEFVRKALRETTEARRALRNQQSLSFGGIRDIRSSLRRIRIGGIAEPVELLDIGDTLSNARRLKTDLSESEEELPILKESVLRIGLFQDIEKVIYDSINDLGEIHDNASPELSRIRKQIRTINERVRQKLESFIRSSEYQKIIQEPIVTHREGRFVIPIRQESRGQFPGIIHDQSSSGATLFIEPMAVVELNNELRQLAKKEQQEIERIIRLICGKISERIDHVEECVKVLAYLDFVIAKGKMSQRMDAWEPELLMECSMNLIQARHPLIGDTVVPIDVRIGTDFNTLVVTGPNTGGKTVALKTMGLLALMAQSGLHIPAKIGSSVGLFHKVFADIGDEQSIEQSLSTFSGHMKNIISMIEFVDQQSLVLLDEIGAGTDPVEGAALAMAILEYLHSRGAKTAATTHYSELKAFAYNSDGVENASVEFNVETLRPTYRLTLGLPGHSNAFAIAQRLGLHSEIIEMAKRKISTETAKVDDMIRSVAELKIQAASDREMAEKLLRQAEADKSRIAEQGRKLKDKEQIIISKAKEEAAVMLVKAKKEIAEIIKDLRKLQLEPGNKGIESEIRAAQNRFSLAENEIEAIEKHEPLSESLAMDDIQPGMEVFIRKLQQSGEVIQVQNRQNTVEVQIGALKLSVPVEELTKPKEAKKNKQKSISKTIIQETVSSGLTEIDLRGQTVNDAMEMLEKYLDSAILSGTPKVNIIHGKGTGALRDAIRKQLPQLPGIKSIRPGESGEGGDGVTVVYFSEME